MATRIGYNTHSRISDYEIGRYIPTIATLFMLLSALGTTPNDFFQDMPTLKEVGEANRDRPSKAKG